MKNKGHLVATLVSIIVLVAASFFIDNMKALGFAQYSTIAREVELGDRIRLVLYILFLSIGIGFSWRGVESGTESTNQKIKQIRIKNVDYPVVLFFAIVWTSVIFFTYSNFLFDDLVDRREIGYHGLARINQVITISLVCYAFYKYGGIRKISIVSILLLANLVPSSIASSRGVALPFIVIGLLFLTKRKFIYSIFCFFIAVYALYVSFVVRGEPSFQNWWGSFLSFRNIGSLDDILIVVIVSSFPGLDTYSAVLGEPQGDFFERLIDFITYLMPIPSFLIGEQFYKYQTLNYITGISLSTVGLNSDLFSEPYLWFGEDFYYIAPLVLSLYLRLVATCLKKSFGTRFSNISQIIFAIALIYFVVGGMVFSLRAATRPFAFIIVVCLIYLIFRFVSKRLRLV